MKRQVHIEKLPSGNYSVRHWQENKFVREWFSDYGLAKNRAAVLTLKLDALKQGQPDPTLRPVDIMEGYLASVAHTHRASTCAMKRAVLQPFVEHTQHITAERIKDWKAGMLRTLSISTVSIRLRELRAMCNWARKEGYLSTNLFEAIPVPAAKEGGMKLELSEIKQLFASSDDVFKPFLGFLIFTGARYSEILKTRWADLDLEKGIWRIPAENCKTNRERTVPLNELLLSILQAMPKTTDLVFQGWARNTARWYLKKACTKIGLEPGSFPSPHDFRHTFASHWTGDTRKLMDMVGWTTMAMLKRYSHFNVENIRKEAEKSGISATLSFDL